MKRTIRFLTKANQAGQFLRGFWAIFEGDSPRRGRRPVLSEQPWSMGFRIGPGHLKTWQASIVTSSAQVPAMNRRCEFLMSRCSKSDEPLPLLQVERVHKIQWTGTGKMANKKTVGEWPERYS